MDQDTQEMRRLRNDMTDFGQRNEPDLCSEEVGEIINNPKKRKSTCDRVPNEVMLAIFAAIGNEIMDLFR